MGPAGVHPQMRLPTQGSHTGLAGCGLGSRLRIARTPTAHPKQASTPINAEVDGGPQRGISGTDLAASQTSDSCVSGGAADPPGLEIVGPKGNQL